MFADFMGPQIAHGIIFMDLLYLQTMHIYLPIYRTTITV